MGQEADGGAKQVWTTPLFPLGQQGLQTARSLDRLDPDGCTYLVNFVRDRIGRQRLRDGQQALVSCAGATAVHSMRRLNDRAAGDYTRFWGADTNLYRGKTGALAAVQAGFSGLPMSLVPHRPTLTGLSYLYVADDNLMGKISRTGAWEGIGVPAPAAATTAVVGAARSKVIAMCAAGDATAAANWTGFAGFDRSASPVASGIPTISDVSGPDGNGIALLTQLGGATAGYNSGASCGMNRDFTTFDGVHDVTDDDLIHLYLYLDYPNYIEEIRVYFVCNSTFYPTSVPGSDPAGNTDAYVKAFSPSELAAFQAQATSAESSMQSARVAQLLKDFGDENAVWAFDRAPDVIEWTQAMYQLKRRSSSELAPVSGQWSEHGILGVPLRRGDFVRIGTDTTRGWADVTGIILTIQTVVKQQVVVGLDAIEIRGGYGPDTSDPAATRYDFRHTSYNVVTGEESNPSPIMAEANYCEAARQPITLDAAVTGNADIRPRYYVRGGLLLTNDWYYVGQGTSDGDSITFEISEEDCLAAGSIETDNDQPITTIDSNGTALYAQPVRILFGPDDSGVLYALGDRNRPGHVYYSKPNQPGSWPAANRVEVTSPSDSLLNGCIYGGQGYVFTYHRMFALIPNLRTQGAVASQSTGCTEGLAAPWGLAVGLGGIYFVSRSGIRVTTGGASTLISEDLRPIFEGQDAYGLRPINWTATADIRLSIDRNELHFHYLDADNVRRHVIFTITPPPVYWREATWHWPLITTYSEIDEGGTYLLLGGATTGQGFYAGGYDDCDGLTHAGIVGRLRTGAWGSDGVEKLLGDGYLDAEFGTALDLAHGGVQVQITTRIDGDTQSLGVTAITPDTTRKPYLFNPFGTDPQKARDVSLDIEVSAAANIAVSPILYRAGVSFLPLGRPLVARPTDWDACGIAVEKFCTGVVVTADTEDADVAVKVERELYGIVSEITEITLHMDGRRRLVYTWAGSRASLLRLRPTGNNPLTIYQADWILVPEPLQLGRWECRETNFGIPGWYTVPYAYLTLQSTAVLTLTVTTHHNQTGGSTTYAYTIASTGGVKRSVWVPFHGIRGVLTKYVFTSAGADFQLYPEESWVLVQPTAGGEAVTRQPFGRASTDLLQGVRSLG